MQYDDEKTRKPLDRDKVIQGERAEIERFKKMGVHVCVDQVVLHSLFVCFVLFIVLLSVVLLFFVLLSAVCCFVVCCCGVVVVVVLVLCCCCWRVVVVVGVLLCVVCCVLCVVCCVLVLSFQTRALMCDVYVHNDMAMQRQSLRLIELITCVMS